MTASAFAPADRRKAASWFIAEGVILVILGILAAALPAFAGLAAALVLGWVLVLGGVLGLASFLGSRAHAHPVWSLVSALAALVAGAFVLWAPIAGAVALALFVAAYFAVDGVSLIALGLDQRRRASRGWGWLVASGVVDLLLGAVVLALGPLSDLVLVGLMVAIDLVFGGIALAMLGLAARRAAG